MARYCLIGQVDPDRVDEYRAHHAQVWPELLTALYECGWRNYSLFLRPDGMLIGYCEADDLDQALSRISEYEVNARWQARMAEFFVSDGPPDQAWVVVEEVFNLEDQLAGQPR